MQDKIIAAIAEYLYHFTESTNNLKKVRFLKAVRHDKTREDFLQEIATEIAAAIAPLVEAGEVGWDNAPEWARWRTVDDDGSITFWELEPVLDDNEFFLNDDGGRKMLVLRPLNKQQRPK